MSLVLAGSFPQARHAWASDQASRALARDHKGRQKDLMGEAPPWWRKDGEMSTGAAPAVTSGLVSQPQL